MLYALCDIGPWEELILSYGPDYWKVMAKVLLRAHAETWEHAFTRCEAIIKKLREKGIRESCLDKCKVGSLAEEVFWEVQV